MPSQPLPHLLQLWSKPTGAGRINRKAAAVLRTSVVGALSYGQGNCGMAPSMLHRQRVAAASAVTVGGAGDLDLTLATAHNSKPGEADPVYLAHNAPTIELAESVWGTWLPRPALEKLLSNASGLLEGKTHSSPWVRGPASAYIMTTRRLGLRVVNATEL